MNIQQFKYVLAVVDSKNYEDASESCFVTQSTLSTMIVRFEKEIGIKIFNRKTKPVSLTKEGETIVERLRLVVSEIEELNSTIKELKGEISGELKIGVIPTIAPYLLPLFLSDFSKTYPKLNITIKEITTTEIEECLSNRTLDIGIVALPVTNSDFITIELYKEPFLIYDCTNKETPNHISVEQIKTDKLWLLQEGHCMRTQINKICQLSSKNTDAKFKFESASMSSLINFTKINKGVTILPYLALESMSQEDAKHIAHFKDTIPVRSIGIITNPFFAKKQLLKLLQNTIQDTVKHLIPTHHNYEVIKGI